MKIAPLLLGPLLFITGCKVFRPSADMNDFLDYAVSPQKTETGNIRVTFFGTSTLLFDDGESQFLMDGFFSRPKFARVGLGRVQPNDKLIAEIIKKHNINRLKGVFVCHTHYDHVMDAPQICKITGAKLYGSASTLFVGKGEGLPDSLMTEFKPGMVISLGNFTITVIESLHTPPINIMGKTNATDPHHSHLTKPLNQPAAIGKFIEGGTFDFYVEHKNGARTLVKASTNFIENALDKFPVDVLFLGTAMLGKMDSTFKDNYYRHTVQATGAKTVVPIHWDNFMKPLTKPLVALPYIGDDTDKSFRYLIGRTAQDSVRFALMPGQSHIFL